MKQVKFKLPLRTLTLAGSLLLAASSFAQSNAIKGHVKDASGEPVMGATITANGKALGITDIDGNFSINAAPGTELTFTYLGMAAQTMKATNNMAIIMKDDDNALNEVVVIGYGQAKKNDLTGSVTAIKPDEKNHGLITNAQDMIQGKIAGVNVISNDGAPGGGATILIRGGSSLNATNEPLIVIDGLAMDNQGVKGLSNPLSMVNPNDIESFTVLKDASATAIYGSRGSNGVIIITTKKGRKNMAPQVTYNGSVSISTKTKTLDVLDANQYREFVKSYYGENSDAAALLGPANTDWQDKIFRTAVSHDHNLTVSGGIANMPYRVSIGYTDQDGILKTSSFQRATASVTLNPSFFKDHLKFNINGKAMYARNRYANTDAISNASRMDPTQPVYSNDSQFANTFGYFDWMVSGSTLNDPNYPLMHNKNASSNPVAMLNEKDDRANSRDYMGNVEVDYQVHGFEDLRLHMNFSGDWANGDQKTTYAPWGPTNFYYGNDGFTKESKYNLTYSAYAQYYKDFAKTQHFDIMGGYEWSHKKYWGNSHYAGIYPSTNTETDKIGTLYNESKSEWKQESYLVSFYGRANYIAFDRYMLTATVRRDGSSRFKEHWATFPSVALGWKISEEAFLKNVKALSELKLRLGWGKTGQQDGIGNYKYFASYNVNSTNVNGRYPINGVNDSGLLYRPDAYNENLSWETTETWNAGLDFSFLNNRITGSVDYYFRKTTDLINTATVATGSNFRNQVSSNIGSLENSGVEMSLTVRPIQSKNWRWEVTANATYNKNEITELTGDAAVVMTGDISAGKGNKVQAQAVGHPANSFYVFQQVYDEAGKPIEGVYVDRNGDGKITDDDRYFYKSPAAPWTAGLSSRLQYKNWDFGFSLRASFDNYVFNDAQAGYVNVEKRYDSSFAYLQNITPSSLANGWVTYDKVISDYFVQNASFLKCDNITLGYSFENLFGNSVYKGFSGRIFLAATNVFTITKYDGVDPEVSSADDSKRPKGIDNNIYPRPFTIQLGLNLNF
ncbi:MAG: TonB-dependent receptor [Prevotella sp.]|nr:TonB-dependent receptor [Prevotella sp.]